MEQEKLFIIDRFEGNWAVIEYGNETFTLPKELLTKANEGDVIEFEVKINKNETNKRKQMIDNLANKLFK